MKVHIMIIFVFDGLKTLWEKEKIMFCFFFTQGR